MSRDRLVALGILPPLKLEPLPHPAMDVVYPIPIREGFIVHVHNLPLDLTQEEARRVGDVIKALAQPLSTGDCP